LSLYLLISTGATGINPCDFLSAVLGSDNKYGSLDGPLQKIIFGVYQKSNKFSIEPCGGNISKLFFDSKHGWNVPLVVLYKIVAFWVHHKSKMSAIKRKAYCICCTFD
jgi:hypothetical protein